MSGARRTQIAATLTCDADDGWYTATVETGEAANGNVRVRLTSRYHSESVAEIAVPAQLLADFGALLVAWFGRKEAR